MKLFERPISPVFYLKDAEHIRVTPFVMAATRVINLVSDALEIEVRSAQSGISWSLERLFHSYEP